MTEKTFTQKEYTGSEWVDLIPKKARLAESVAWENISDAPTYLTKAEQTTTSTTNGGSNVVTFTDSSGTTSTLTVKNGSAGSRGSIWYSGTVMTATNTTATVYSSSGISSAIVGDMYLNTSTWNLYKCTTAGNASTAKWTLQCNIRGASGTNATTTSLSNGTSTAGLIKTTSNVSSSSGYTACPVINGVPYYQNSTSYLPLSGGTLTGGIEIKDSTYARDYATNDVWSTDRLNFNDKNGARIGVLQGWIGKTNNGLKLITTTKDGSSEAFTSIWDNGWIDVQGGLNANSQITSGTHLCARTNDSNQTLYYPTYIQQYSNYEGVTCQQYKYFNSNCCSTDELQSSGTHRFLGKCPVGTTNWFGIHMDDTNRRTFVDYAEPTTSNLRNITISTSNPSGGSDGDIWIVY